MTTDHPVNAGITVVDVGDIDPDVAAAMLTRASSDPTICHNAFLPAGLDETSARVWLADHTGTAWFIRLDGEPVGWYEVAPLRNSCGVAVPDGAGELEVWLLEHARGRQAVRTATTLLRGELHRRGVTAIVGIAWETNTASIAAMGRAGFTYTGSGWWESDDEEGGWCQVWTLPLP